LDITSTPGNQINGNAGWFKPAGIDPGHPNGIALMNVVSGAKN